MTSAFIKTSLLCAASLLFIVSSQAQSIKQKDLIAHDKIQVAERAKDANTACGTNITFSMNYDTFADVSTSPDNPNQQNPWAFFANVTDALKVVCGTPDGKAGIQAKIKSVVVSHGAKESESMSGTTFNYVVPYHGAGTQTIIAYLRNNL